VDRSTAATRPFGRRIVGILAIVGGLVAFAPSCDDSDDDHGHEHGEDLGPNCRDIVDACHYKDDGTDPEISQCHVVGHDGDETECALVLDECVAICEAAPDPS
jgi:hypothetical protein